jgi:iron complex transport system ATP-binding protein
MLKIQDVTLGYKTKEDVIKSVDLNICEGELVVIIGPNGSGKSTLLKSIAGNLKPRKGQILIKGKSLSSYSTKALAQKIAFLPQFPTVPNDYTVRELISYGRFPHLKWTGKMQSSDWDIIDWAMELTHLTTYANRPMAALSGGERQRAWVALALAQKPQILILDEPTTYLDISFQFEVLELIKSLNKKLNITTLIVLHDLNQAARFADRIIVLENGSVVLEGKPDKIIRNGELERIFQITVGIRKDTYNDCPYLIPLKSRRTIFNARVGDLGA